MLSRGRRLYLHFFQIEQPKVSETAGIISGDAQEGRSEQEEPTRSDEFDGNVTTDGKDNKSQPGNNADFS